VQVHDGAARKPDLQVVQLPAPDSGVLGHVSCGTTLRRCGHAHALGVVRPDLDLSSQQMTRSSPHAGNASATMRLAVRLELTWSSPCAGLTETPHPQPKRRYLERAFKTSMKIGSPNVGLMDGTVFREVLLALHEEGESNSTVAGWATQLEAAMRSRAVGWAAQTFPYGSEFNFDTTGQEEV
jgi:hypothetical protein